MEPRLSDRTVRRATVVLIALRIGYAYNWFSIGPALVPIGNEFGIGPAGFGLLVAVFLLGAGLLQVPAGFLARRFGARTVSLAGVALLAVSTVGAAYAPTFPVLLAGRLLGGAGAALFFSPAIGLVASLYPPGRRGLPVGTFSSAYSAGAGLGVLGTSLLLPDLGWRLAVALGGVVLAAICLAGVAWVPRAAGARPPRTAPRSRGLPRALRYRGVWAVGFAFVGLEGATFATGQFLVPYGETIAGWSIALSGIVAMLYVLPSLFGGPVGGPVAERHRNHRTQFLVATLAGGLPLALIPVAGLAGAVAIGILFSFCYGAVYAIMYVLPHFWQEVDPAEVPLAIGLFNSIQLAGGALVSLAFGAIVAATSYSVAWELLAAIVALSLLALLALPPTPARRAGPPAEAAAVPP